MVSYSIRQMSQSNHFTTSKTKSAVDSSSNIFMDAIQLQRVRKSKIKPILTGYKAEEHRSIVDKMTTVEEYRTTILNEIEHTKVLSKENFGLLSNPFRKSDFNLESMRSAEMSDISHFSRDSDIRDIKATLNEIKGSNNKSWSQFGSKNLNQSAQKTSKVKSNSRINSDYTYESEEVIGEEFLEEIEEVDQETFDSLKRRQDNNISNIRSFK